MVIRRLVAAVLVGALTFAGCTSMRTIPPASPGEPPFGPVRKGDTVVVHTRDGVSARFVVHLIDGETLIAADGRRYVRSDLLRVQYKAFSRLKTAGLIFGGVFVIVEFAVGLWIARNSA